MVVVLPFLLLIPVLPSSASCPDTDCNDRLGVFYILSSMGRGVSGTATDPGVPHATRC